MKTNLADITAKEWSEFIQALYGEIDIETLIAYINRTNTYYDGYQRKGGENEYGLIVPFPNGYIVLNCVREDGLLTSIEVELPPNIIN